MRTRAPVALTVAVAAMSSFAVACHSKPKTEVPSGPPLVARAFGDTAAYGVQVLSLDREKEVAKVALRAPAELIVLAVIPGREIELIVPADLTKQTRASFSKGVSNIDMARWDASPRPMAANTDAQRALEYNRCLQQAQAAARRVAQARRPVKRDSTGKIIDDGRGDSSAEAAEIAARMERECDRLDANTSTKPAPPVRLPARAPADRYLVVLASSTPLSSLQLGERLSTLTAVGSDVATTIEAIAAGMYAGLPGTWGGTYVAW